MISGLGSHEQQPRLEIMQRRRTIHRMIAQTYDSGGLFKLCWDPKTFPATTLLNSIKTLEHAQISGADKYWNVNHDSE